MKLWERHTGKIGRSVERCDAVGAVRCAALIAWFAGPLPALAQDNVVATATLPRDLSPWRMYLNADPVVKAVLIGLVFASMGAARDRARTRGRWSSTTYSRGRSRAIAPSSTMPRRRCCGSCAQYDLALSFGNCSEIFYARARTNVLTRPRPICDISVQFLL